MAEFLLETNVSVPRLLARIVLLCYLKQHARSSYLRKIASQEKEYLRRDEKLKPFVNTYKIVSNSSLPFLPFQKWYSVYQKSWYETVL